ncbi:MAG: TRAP transporter large permease subunit [Deltaproteobacteria bacterium]|nr:TRAP transporter large permease subunit [Deltaproteobacteria bacterium]
MSIELLSALLFAGILISFVIGTPVAFALGGLAMAFGAILWGPQSFQIIPSTAMGAVTNFILLAIPLFIFMGQILLRSGMGEAMFHAMHILAGRLRGGLAIGVIIMCTLMSAMVGIIGAGILTAGTVCIPPMLKRLYDKHLTLGAVMAGGGMGILIPPSIVMIVFSSQTNTSLGKMFAGGVIPGLLMSSLFVLYIASRCFFSPAMGPPLSKKERGVLKDKVIAARDLAIAFGLVFMVLGSILFGVATPTEAAAVGSFGAAGIALFYRQFNWNVIREASIGSMKLTGMVVWIIIGATTFSNFYMLMGAGKLLNKLTIEWNVSPMGVIVLMQMSLLLLGCFIDEFIIVLICAPLYTPMAVSLGFDPIWFGILMILNMEIAIQTPPYGFALFYLKAVAPPQTNMTDIYKSIIPFVSLKFIVLGLCMVFPGIVTWLPDLLFP